jgi:hypothetical protein
MVGSIELLLMTVWPFLMIVGSVFLVFWLNQKKQRDELVLALLGEIHALLVEIADLMKRLPQRRR